MREQRHLARARRVVAPLVVLFLACGVAACGTTAALAPKAATKVSTMTVDALITAGKAAQQKGDPTGAAALYTKAIADDPANAVALYDLGDLDQTALYEHSAAEAEYERALAVDPHFIDARFNLAILQSTGQPMRAIASYHALIGFDASDAYAYLNLGFLLRTVGQTTASAAAFRKALKLDPGLKSRMSEPIAAK